MKILLVDDSRAIAMITTARLESFGHEVRHAINGPTAIELFQKESFDLILMDIEMPGMNGTELMRAVRADEKLKDLPVIMMLAVGAGKQDVLNTVALGISGFVIKPFKPDPLRAQVKKVLGW